MSWSLLSLILAPKGASCLQHNLTSLIHTSCCVSPMTAMACHWKQTDQDNHATDTSNRREPSWTGFSAFQVTAVEFDGSLCLFSRNQIIFVHDADAAPTNIDPKWWGTTVKDQMGKDLSASTWCSTMKEAIDEAVHSKDRGIRTGSTKSTGHEWETVWWLVWELTLYGEAVTDLVNMHSLSPGAIYPKGLMMWDPETKTRKQHHTIKTWNISVPIDMKRLSGWHRTHRSGMSTHAMGRCEKHLVKQKQVWEDVRIQLDENLTALSTGRCRQWGCLRNTALFNGKCSECWNMLWANNKHNIRNNQNWILECETQD